MSFLGGRRGDVSEAAALATRKVWRRYAFLLASSLIAFACGQHDEVQPVDPASPASPGSAASAPPWAHSAPTLQVAKQPPPACKAAILNVGATPSMAPGAAVTLGVAASCSGPTVEYSFSYAPSDDSAHPVQLRDFAASPTFVWDTTGVAPGSYSLLAQARESGSATVATASGKVSLGATPDADLPEALNGARTSKLLPPAAAKPAPDFAAGMQAKSLGPSALTTYPLSADGKYYKANLLHRNFLPPTANATFANGAYQLGQAAPPLIFDGRDAAFTVMPATPGDPNATVTLTVDMGQYYSVGAIRPLYQPLGGGYPFNQRIRLATKLGPNADWLTVVEGPVTPADTTLSLVQPAAGRYLELTMIGNGANLLELFVYPSAQTSPPPTSADGYDLSSIGASSTWNENFFAPGVVWPQTWPVGGFYPKSLANGGTGDAVATIDLGAQYDVSRLGLGFFWSTGFVNGGRLEVAATPDAFSTIYDSGLGQPFTPWPAQPEFFFPSQPVQYIRATDYFTPADGAGAGTLWSVQAFQTPPPHVGYYPLSADGKYFAVNLARRPTGDIQPSASVVYVNGVTPSWSPQSVVAGNAIDGDDNTLVLYTSWVADPDASATLTVDLKQVQSIGAIRQFYNYVPVSSSIRVAEKLDGPWTQVLVDTPATGNDFTSSFDAVSAQYVELTMKGTPTGGFANLVELQVFPSSATDPAPSSGSHLDLTYLTGMTTSVNANMGVNGGAVVHAEGGGPGYYVKTAAQGGTGDATLTLDLGQLYQVSELTLSWLYGETWPAGGKVDVDDGSGKWVQVFDSKRGTPLGSAADGPQRIPFGAAYPARYVRITGYFDPSAASSGLLLGIELFGDSSCATTCSGKHCGDSLGDGCGGQCAPVCGSGAVGCKFNADCQSGLACAGIPQGSSTAGTCQPVASHCGNGVLDADESDVDCGGTGCLTCPTGKLCNSQNDCTSDAQCGVANGACFGHARGQRVCWKPSCELDNHVAGCGQANSDCGQNCDCVTSCDVTNPSAGCPAGETCKPQGRSFGLPQSGVCLASACPSNDPALCGTNDSLCGPVCQCTANCSAATCDNPGDGCGGFCPGVCATGQNGCSNDISCPTGQSCIANSDGTRTCRAEACAFVNLVPPLCGTSVAPCGAQCPTCTASCGGRQCGADPNCGQSCGTCDSGSYCSADGQCVTPPVVPPLTVADSNGGTHPVVPLTPPTTTPVGAVSGQFSVSDDGTALYNIPIQVPPGRAGIEPALSISYGSSKTNGDEGIGWHLEGLSKITRCPRSYALDGYAAPIKGNGSDVFCIDGKRLESVSGTYGLDGTQYRTVIDSFAKVVSHSDSGTGLQLEPFSGIIPVFGDARGPDYFRVFTKDGKILTFGHTPDSLVMARNGVRYAWLLNKVEDRASNTMTVGYTTTLMSLVQDLFAGIPKQFRPAFIAYTGHGETAGNRRVVFSYEPRPDKQVTFGQGGAPYMSSDRLSLITTFVGNTPAKNYRINYRADIGALSQVEQISECAGASATLCKNPTRFEYIDDDGFTRGIEQHFPNDIATGGSLDLNGD